MNPKSYVVMVVEALVICSFICMIAIWADYATHPIF